MSRFSFQDAEGFVWGVVSSARMRGEWRGKGSGSKSAAGRCRGRGSDDESWLQTLFFVVDELVCDFLTLGVCGAVTIKNHGGMTSSHTLSGRVKKPVGASLLAMRFTSRH
ncbi:hypothetical protein [Pseudomonas sp. DP16D-R1]|uniref:hypothetical protein n=1 Tax=Pseudomonas sp. DP16D-R1 TaxID=2075551 RepID=UPI0011AF3FD0|nr:hypothetical protein [Pseudomonas sp. DP16D-R1]